MITLILIFFWALDSSISLLIYKHLTPELEGNCLTVYLLINSFLCIKGEIIKSINS